MIASFAMWLRQPTLSGASVVRGRVYYGTYNAVGGLKSSSLSV